MNKNSNHPVSARLCWILAALAVTPHLPVWPAVVGIDARHGSESSAAENLATGQKFDQFRASIASAGHTLVNVFTFEGGSLSGLDAVILTQATAPGSTEYSPAEISSIFDFVAEGHGLLLIGEGGYGRDATVANFNLLAAPFGVTYGPSPLAAQGYTVTGFDVHPVTLGVTMVGVDFYRPFSSVLTPAVDLTLASGPDDILAAVNGAGGAGNVVLVSDPSMWSDPGVVGADRPITFGDNLLLLQNTLSYIAVPEPSVFGLLGCGTLMVLTAAMRLRRQTTSK